MQKGHILTEILPYLIITQNYLTIVQRIGSTEIYFAIQ